MVRCPYCKSYLIKKPLNQFNITKGVYDEFKKVKPKKTKLISVRSIKSYSLGSLSLCPKCTFCTTLN